MYYLTICSLLFFSPSSFLFFYFFLFGFLESRSNHADEGIVSNGPVQQRKAGATATGMSRSLGETYLYYISHMNIRFGVNSEVSRWSTRIEDLPEPSPPATIRGRWIRLVSHRFEGTFVRLQPQQWVSRPLWGHMRRAWPVNRSRVSRNPADPTGGLISLLRW